MFPNRTGVDQAHPQPCRHRRRGSAFSLIELVLVMAILAVVAAIAAPRYAAAVTRYHADAAARRVAADLALAQASARTASQSRTVVFDLTQSQVRITGLTDVLRNNANTYVTDLSAHPYRARIVSANFAGGSQVIFDGFGVPNTGGQVVLARGSVQRTIILNADTGQVVLP